MSEPDFYDRAVAYLTERPEEIQDAWFENWPDSEDHPAHWLFAVVSKSGHGEKNPDGKCCGCLTQIKSNAFYAAWTEELRAEIRADDTIPRCCADEIEIDDLPAFARWQRKIDRELNRTPPVWREPEAI